LEGTTEEGTNDDVEPAAATDDTLRCLVISILEDVVVVFYGNCFNYCC